MQKFQGTRKLRTAAILVCFLAAAFGVFAYFLLWNPGEAAPKGFIMEKSSAFIKNGIHALNIRSTAIDKKTVKQYKQGDSSQSSASTADSKNTVIKNKEQRERDAALLKISKGLNAALGSVSTEGQKAVISQMISTVNTMIGNPSYSANKDVASIRAAYNKLTTSQKNQLKSAIFFNIDITAVSTISRLMAINEQRR